MDNPEQPFPILKQPFEWKGDHLEMLDQTALPEKVVYLRLENHYQVADAIRRMRVRGAPAIGIAAGYGVVLGAGRIPTADVHQYKIELDAVFATLAATRPTARNLFDVLESLGAAVGELEDPRKIQQKLASEIETIHREQKAADAKLSLAGAELIAPESTLLTHCNTGPLATGGYGTALGIIIAAHRAGKAKMVLATETRPLLQGARLTAWELQQAGIPFRLITDSMAAHFMSRGVVDAVIVGADRIAAGGDTANKIGTYALALLAEAHHIPFYVAAPFSTVDLATRDGAGIPIEERSESEVTSLHGVQVAPSGTRAFNPAFDVTPAQYITAIVTEKGVFYRRGDSFDFDEAQQ